MTHSNKHQHIICGISHNSIGELGISDEEGGDAFIVQQANQSVDLRVHDGLPHQGEGTVPGLHTLRHALWLHSRNTCSSTRSTWQVWEGSTLLGVYM